MKVFQIKKKISRDGIQFGFAPGQDTTGSVLWWSLKRLVIAKWFVKVV